MPSPSPLLPVLVLIGLSTFGAYTCMYAAARDGFFEALGACVNQDSYDAGLCQLTAAPNPSSVGSHVYTTVKGVDKHLAGLVEFFAQGLNKVEGEDEGRTLGMLVAGGYMMAQFGGVWLLVLMESLRRGSKGSVLAWSGAAGTLCQLVTVAVTSPLYFSAQIWRYAAADASPTWSDVAIDPLDLRLLPASTVLGFVVPSVAMVLPDLLGWSTRAKYIAIAAWQPFPLLHGAIHAALRTAFGGRKASTTTTTTGLTPDAYKRTRSALRVAYGFAIVLVAAPHLILAATAGRALYEHDTPVLETVSALMAPHSLLEPPTRAVATPPVSTEAALAIVGSFLRWDIYTASTAALVWSTYVSYRTSRGKGAAELLRLLVKVVLGVVAAGPLAPALVLMWERDLVLLDQAASKTARLKKIK